VIGRPIRLLITCRDPNGANQILQLAPTAMRRSDLSVALLADEIGLKLLRDAGLPVEPADVPVVARNDLTGRVAALQRAQSLLARYSPDAVLTCYSGPSAGVDEAMVAVASPATTFLLQDFWGDINSGFGRVPGTVFVLDEAADALTRRNHAVRTVVTGMPKFEAYAQLDIAEMRARTRRSLGIRAEKAVLGFFGQPLWHLDAYRAAVDEIMAAVGAYREATLLLRPHPRDETDSLDRLGRSIKAAGVPVHAVGRDKFGRIEDVLAACDIACSAYSSSCHDMIVMNRVAREPGGRALFYLPDPLRRIYREEVGHGAVPPVDAGLAIAARTEVELANAIAKALVPASREAAWRHIRASSPRVEGASDRILHHIVAAVGARARVA